MKNIVQFIALLVLVCAILWLIGTRISNIEDKESQISQYQAYDPFKEDLEVAEPQVSAAPQQGNSKEEKPSQLAQETSTPTQVSAIEDDLANIELKVTYDKLAANIDRTSISNIFFTKPEQVCSLQNSFNPIYDSLKKNNLQDILLTIEPLLPKSEDFSPTKAKISLKMLTRDNILNINFPNKGRPQLVGIYLCSDEENTGNCAGKNPSTADSIGDGVLFFTYAYFDLESFSLLTFPESTKDKYIDKFARTNFGPIDKSNLAYLNSKNLALNLSSSIRLKNTSSSISFIFPFYDSANCGEKTKLPDK